MENPFHNGDKNSYPTSFFSVRRRNFGHWDINTGEGRACRIRGGPSEWLVFDERTLPGPGRLVFKDQGAAMSFICAEMMHELLATESQNVHRIEDWNVSEVMIKNHKR